jgi:hypothetical protein
MLKKLITIFFALLVGLHPVLSQAADLQSAFGNLVGDGATATYSRAGAYTSGARNIFVGGGVEVRFPQSRTTLVSVTPPGFSAGCQGISAHFGGISFISGKEIEALVRNIAQGAPGLIINMVIKALCPMCEAVLQNMQKLAQFAAKANMDSCRIANNLVGMLGKEVIGSSASGSEALNGACATRGSALNAGTDWYDTNMSVCQSLSGAVGKLEGYWKQMEDGLYGTSGAVNGSGSAGGGGTRTPTSVAGERCTYGVGNCTWVVLSEVFPTIDKSATPNTALTSDAEVVRKRLLIMNLLGTVLQGNGASCGADSGTSETGSVYDRETRTSFRTIKCLPKLEPKQLIGMFMCGNYQGTAASGSQSMAWTAYCSSMFTTTQGGTTQSAATVLAALKDIPVMDCGVLEGETESPYKNCKTIVPKKVGELDLVSGKGFLREVQDLLTEAVTRVRNNRSMADDATGRQIITLINLAPYPLYQAINAAAVYPEAGQQLIDSLSLLVADHLAYAYFQQFMSLSTQTSFAAVAVPPNAVDRLAAAMNAIRMEGDLNKARMGKTLATQQLVMEEIRKVNSVIQQSVMSEQLLNQQKYANTINTNAANASSDGK